MALGISWKRTYGWLALRDRVLVTAQTTGSENGIYYVTTVGAGSNGTWARSLDADATGEIKAGTIIMITEGTTYVRWLYKLKLIKTSR